MVTLAKNPNPFDEIQLVPPAVPDRLPAMLFLAALIHGILIIGVTFNPYLLDGSNEAISLEVTIVANPDQDIDRPDEAEYLAQASQLGGGNTADEVRATAPLESVSSIENPGVEDGDSLREAIAHDVSADQVLMTQNDTDRAVADELRDDPEIEASTAIVLEAGSENTLALPHDTDATFSIHDDDPRHVIIGVDTRHAEYAPYLSNWKGRIEAVGDDYFANLGHAGSFDGSPTLEVTIESSGALSQVLLEKSSGSPVIDQAALDIIRRGAPFDPFSVDVSEDFDRLSFRYKFKFSDPNPPSTASLN
ncbi:MAG: energy transducer TonB [Pseudomonadota bacterium]